MEVSPTKDTQSQPIQPDYLSVSNQHKPTINTPRDYRFILNLLGGSEVPTHDLVISVGSANIWEHCRQLKKRGWLINTTKNLLQNYSKKLLISFERSHLMQIILN